MINYIDLKFTSQKHYKFGGIDTMDYLNAKLNDEQYVGLTVADVIRYVSRYLESGNIDDMEKALTMQAWCVHRLRGNQSSVTTD